MMKKKLIQILALVLAVSIPSTWAITTQTAKKVLYVLALSAR